MWIGHGKSYTEVWKGWSGTAIFLSGDGLVSQRRTEDKLFCQGTQKNCKRHCRACSSAFYDRLPTRRSCLSRNCCCFSFVLMLRDSASPSKRMSTDSTAVVVNTDQQKIREGLQTEGILFIRPAKLAGIRSMCWGTRILQSLPTFCSLNPMKAFTYWGHPLPSAHGATSQAASRPESFLAMLLLNPLSWIS